MATEVTLTSPEEGVALITLSAPEIDNFISLEGIDALAGALARAREGGARVSVLASGVEGHWYEHAWLTDLRALFRGEPATGDGSGWFHALREITSPEVISVAAISGDCSGGGAELGWACDLRVAEEQVIFGQPEVQIGLATGVGGTTRLARLIGPTLTAEMVLDGRPQTAQRIHERGGINRVVPRGQAVSASVAWAGELASRRHESLVALKRMLHASENLPLDEALAREQQLFQGVAGSRDGLEGMRRTQERFDAGETLRQVYGSPR